MTPAEPRALTPFPWAEALGFGLGLLRLSPAAFWSMTPRELTAAHRGLFGRGSQTPLSRASLDQLLTRFPD